MRPAASLMLFARAQGLRVCGRSFESAFLLVLDAAVFCILGEGNLPALKGVQPSRGAGGSAQGQVPPEAVHRSGRCLWQRAHWSCCTAQELNQGCHSSFSAQVQFEDAESNPLV